MTEGNRNCTNKEFFDSIAKEIDLGYRFTPFVGSGLSSRSGILMGQDFSIYLSYVVMRCVLDRESQTSLFKNSNEKKDYKRISILQDGWPNKPSPSEVLAVKKWVQSTYEKLFDKHSTTNQFNVKKKLSTFSDLEFINTLHIPLCPRILFFDYGQDVQERDSQLLKLYKIINSNGSFYDLPRADNILEDSIEAAIEAGIRSLYDWRATLNFIARLKHDENSFYFETSPNQYIIDSFNEQLVHDKRPSLAHYVLAHLMRPLRIRTILTTNFDTLIEQAIRNIKMPFSVFDVRLNSGLPNPELIHLQTSVVKLHGSSIDTRSDFTLDITPDREERLKFEKYLCKSSNELGQNIPSHLLVMGFSGRDQRVIQLMRHTLERNATFKIYWIAFSDNEIEYLNSLFPKEFYPNVLFITATRQDLFLYELYQKLTLSLPPGGLSYELGHYVPPYYKDQEASQDNIKLEEKKSFLNIDAFEVVFECIQNKHNDSTILPNGCYFSDGAEVSSVSKGIFLTIDSKSGVAAPMRSLFHKFKKIGYSTIWLELEDYTSTSSLASKLFQVMSLENNGGANEYFGIDVGNNCNFDDKFESYLKNYISVIGIVPENWIFFLYGRNGPGGCSGWENNYWQETDYEQLSALNSILKKLGFKIIYMPLSKDRFDRNKEKENFVINVVNQSRGSVNRHENSIPEKVSSEIKLFQNLAGMSEVPNKEPNTSFYKCRLPESVIDKSLNFPNKEKSTEGTFNQLFRDAISSSFFEDRDGSNEMQQNIETIRASKIHFLYSSTLFRQSRHPSAFYSEAVYPCPEKFNGQEKDNDFIRAENVERWLRQLEGSVFFKKPGGYVWKYRDVRLGIRHYLESIYYPAIAGTENSENKTDFLFQRRARTHFWIGDWYLRTFHSIKHVAPLIEAIYHRVSSINFTSFAKPNGLEFPHEETTSLESKNNTEEGAIYFYRFHLLQSALIEIIKTLRISRPIVTYWGKGAQAEEIMSLESFYSALGLSEVANIMNHKNLEPLERDSKAKQAIFKWILLKVGLESRENLRLNLAERYIAKKENITFKSEFTDQELNPQENSYFGYRGLFHRNICELFESLVEEVFAVNKDIAVKTGKQVNALSPIHKLIPFESENPNGNAGATYANPKTYLVPYRKWTDTIKAFQNAISSILKKSKTGSAENDVEDFFRLTDFKDGISNAKVKQSDIKRDISEIKQRWVITLAGNYEAILELATVLNEYAYALSRHAKVINRLNNKQLEKLHHARFNVIIKDSKFLREIWKNNVWTRVCSVCWIGQDLLKNVHPNFLSYESPLKLKFLSFYGLALANLGRFYEAQRRFNEASAYLSYGSEYEENINLAVLRIRRAEAHILIAKKVEKCIGSIGHLEPDKCKDIKLHNALELDDVTELPYWLKRYKNEKIDTIIMSLSRLLVAKLDDASVSIEAAESLMVNYDKSSHWWGHLNLLKLSLARYSFSASVYSTCFFQRKSDKVGIISALFKKGILISQNDPYRKLRLIDEFLEASIQLHILQNQQTAAKKMIGTSKYSVNKMIFPPVFIEVFPSLIYSKTGALNKERFAKVIGISIRRQSISDKTLILPVSEEVRMYFDNLVSKLEKVFKTTN